MCVAASAHVVGGHWCWLCVSGVAFSGCVCKYFAYTPSHPWCKRRLAQDVSGVEWRVIASCQRLLVADGSGVNSVWCKGCFAQTVLKQAKKCQRIVESENNSRVRDWSSKGS